MKMFGRWCVALLMVFAISGFAQAQNYALYFDGDDDVVDLEPGALDGLSDVTVEYWVKFIHEESASVPFIGRNAGEMYEYFHAWRGAAGYSTGVMGAWDAPGPQLPDDEWFHLAVTRDGATGEVKVYVNAILIDVDSLPAGALFIETLMLGQNTTFDPGHALHGYIDELRIWNYVRSQWEIQLTMNLTVNDLGDPGSVPAGLHAYYRFNEGAGTDVFDTATAGAYDGTFGGGTAAPTWVLSDAPFYSHGGAFPTSHNTFYQGWTLMSIPGEPDLAGHPECVNPFNIFDDDITGPDIPWQLIGFTNDTGFFWNYPPLPPDEDPVDVEFGAAYWLAIVFDDEATVDLPTGWDPYTGTWTVDLDWGWNMLGYPFSNPSHMSQWTFTFDGTPGTTYNYIEAAMNGLIVPVIHVAAPEFGYWGYWHHFGATQTIYPWYGFWFLTRVDGVNLIIDNPPPFAPGSGSSEIDEIGAENWQVAIVAQLDGATLGAPVIGVAPDATAEFDVVYDFPAPPNRPSADGAAYFQRDWNSELGEEYVQDFSAPMEIGSSRSWDFTVEAEGEVTLEWPQVGTTTPAGLEFELALPGGETVNMNEESTASFTASGTHTVTVTATANATDVETPVQQQMPTEFGLANAYPNPFNPSTTIEYTLPRAADVRITVYDVVGREVATLLNSSREAGRYSVSWNAADQASGLYFVRMEAAGQADVTKVMLMK